MIEKENVSCLVTKGEGSTSQVTDVKIKSGKFKILNEIL